MNGSKNINVEQEIYEINEENGKNSKKVNEINVSTVLKPEEAIAIAKKYHREMNLEGVVNENVNRLLFNEEYAFRGDMGNRSNIVIKAAWKVFVDFSIPNFDPVDYILIVSDRDREVMGILNSYYQPMELPKERSEDYVYDPNNFDGDDDDEEEEEDDDNDEFKKLLKSFDDE